MRLLTRSDFDGLVCAVLLKDVGVMTERKFVHPKDIQDGKVEVTKDDVLANIPYVPGCGLWFDHHSSEEERKAFDKFEGACYRAPSAAQVIYEYYGGEKKFGEKFNAMMTGVNKSDSGNLTMEEILDPAGWILMSFIMDPRTGLGRYKDYRISNYQLMDELIEYCRNLPIEQILAEPDVKQRVDRYFEQDKIFRKMLRERSKADGHISITDLRGLPEIFTGNRFMIYCLYPDTNINIRVMDGKNQQNVVFAVGHSVINRGCRTNVGKLMLKYGGGGHDKVGTCQVPYNDAEKVLQEMIAQMKQDG
jgi:oligoribonuclease NrnB/cAMP/cGMP phosphodiesterase (DHH superfamily)